MLTMQCEYRVTYGDTDKMGYLYYGHYAKLYEIGRAEMLRDLGVTYQALENEHGYMMPVVSLECRYRGPAHYDDLLTIETTLEGMPTKMITMKHRILRGDELLNTGTVKLFFVEIESQKRVSCPDYLSNSFSQYFE